MYGPAMVPAGLMLNAKVFWLVGSQRDERLDFPVNSAEE